jgi:alkylation response protein AidB-like acyl-CoA dehydrogenase
MTYRFSPDQEQLRRTTRDYLAAHCGPRQVREAWTPGADADRTRWHGLADLGVTAANVPLEYDGLGLPDADLTVVLEEIGYAALPEPLLETISIVTPYLRDFGTPEQKECWLPRIAAGEAIASAQIMGAGSAVWGAAADVILVEDGGTLQLVDGATAEKVTVSSMDVSRHPATIRAGSAARFASGDTAPALLSVQGRAAAASAAVLNGVSLRLLEMSVAYAKVREQFGRPIGSFQAVKHLLAEIACAVETARPSAWHAASTANSAPGEFDIDASVAKVMANEAASLASYHALQVHGGIGFTWEHDLHLWMKRARCLEESFGSTRHHQLLLGRRVVDSPDLMAEFGPALTA